MKWNYHLIFLLLLTVFCFPAYAWKQSMLLGYGYSQDPNGSRYHNSGFLLSGDFYPLSRGSVTFWTLNAALGQWHTTAPQNKNLTTGAISLALRLYPFHMQNATPYFLGSAGPALLSHKRFGVNTQGSIITIQTNLGLGAEFNCFDANLRLVHFSNANLRKPNEGFNILYLLSVGYLFG